jgi:hypothetical protein
VLAIFFAVDSWFYAGRAFRLPVDPTPDTQPRPGGRHQRVLLLGVVAAGADERRVEARHRVDV